MNRQAAFDRRILQPLDALRRRVRRHVFVQGLAATAAAGFGLTVVLFAADFLLVLQRVPRAAGLLLLLGVLGSRAWRRLVRPLRAPLDPMRLAATLERLTPALQDRLISAVQFASARGRPPGVPAPDESAPMMQAVMERAMQDAESIGRVSLVKPRPTHRALAALVVILALSAAATAWRPELIDVFVSRNFLMAGVPWPSRYRLVLAGDENGLLRRPRGDELTLTVNVQGKTPPAMRMAYETDRGRRGEHAMSRVGTDRFRCDFGPLNDSMRIRFIASRWGADVPTQWYRIEAVDRPRVASAAVKVTPPLYTRRDPYQLARGQTGGDIASGSSIRIEAHMNKPVRSARLRGEDRDLGPAESQGERRWTADVTPRRTGSFRFELVDEFGFENTDPVRFAFRLIPDRPPSVRLQLPGVGLMILPGAVLPIDAELEDNWGLASAKFEFLVDRIDAATQPAPVTEVVRGFEPYQQRLRRQWAWDLSALALRPQDRLVMTLRAADFCDTDPAKQVGSASRVLRVVTRNELAAELTRRELEWRQQFEQVIRYQESRRDRLREIIDSGPQAAAITRATREARVQRQVSRRLDRIRSEFESVQVEMRINQMLTPDILERLSQGVIRPLTLLSNNDVPAAADALTEWTRTPSDAAAELVLRAQATVIDGMRTILESMLKWEGFHEATALLREILKQQSELNRQTEAAIERQIERLFGSPPREN
ncbi:MAG: hypothetical protein V3T70_01970 [Phycisphaerae bacterium]